MFVHLFYNLALLMQIRTSPEIPNHSRINNANILIRQFVGHYIYTLSYIIVSEEKGRVFLVGTLLKTAETLPRLDILLAMISHNGLHPLPLSKRRRYCFCHCKGILLKVPRASTYVSLRIVYLSIYHTNVSMVSIIRLRQTGHMAFWRPLWAMSLSVQTLHMHRCLHGINTTLFSSSMHTIHKPPLESCFDELVLARDAVWLSMVCCNARVVI